MALSCRSAGQLNNEPSGIAGGGLNFQPSGRSVGGGVSEHGARREHGFACFGQK